MIIFIFLLKLPAFLLCCTAWMLSEMLFGLSLFFEYVAEILEDIIDDV